MMATKRPRHPKQRGKVQMRLHVRGQRIEGAFYSAVIIQRVGRSAKARQKGPPEPVRREQPVQVASLDPP